jgi:dienelactone hydrolase
VGGTTAGHTGPLASSRRLLGLLVVLAVLALALNLAAAPAAPGLQPVARGAPAPSHGASTTGGQEAAPPAPSPAQPSSPVVGLRVLHLVDTARTIRLAHGRTEARPLVTYVRYPALGAPGRTDVLDAPAAHAGGPYPLVIFGHGFAVTPRLYAHLLQSWTRAGYVVAAPVFPLGNANAPGGPDESDLVNQPTDMSVVISRLLAASATATSPLSGLIDPTHIAVTGQSDGGVTALAVAYSRRFRDPRVDAAVVMSGAEMSGAGGFSFRRGGPPLLATQGTADTINEPRFTYAFFDAARRPKYLLRLLGAGHLPPYTRQQPQLAIVERVTIAFLDGYLKRRRRALQGLVPLGTSPRAAAILADP